MGALVACAVSMSFMSAGCVLVRPEEREILAEPFQVNSQEFFITTSIGIASFPSDERGAEELLKCADDAMYRSKSAGRDQVSVAGQAAA